jgi:hypothetical protein
VKFHTFSGSDEPLVEVSVPDLQAEVASNNIQNAGRVGAIQGAAHEVTGKRADRLLRARLLLKSHLALTPVRLLDQRLGPFGVVTNEGWIGGFAVVDGRSIAALAVGQVEDGLQIQVDVFVLLP